MAQTTQELLDLYSNQALLPMLKARGVFAKQTRKADMLAALVKVVEDTEGAHEVFSKLAPSQKLLLCVLQEQDGQSTARALKTAANRAGVSNFDEHLRELMRQALVF